MAGKKRELLEQADGPRIDAAERAVRDKGSLPRARLPGWKLFSAAGQASLVDALLGRGLEAGDKGALRVPLREQTAALTNGGARVPLSTARRRLSGATAKEKDAALAEACARGALSLVVRTKVETVVGAGERVLSPEDVEALAKAHAALGAVLKRVTKKGSAKSPLGRSGRSLLVEDAAGLLAPMLRLARTEAEPPAQAEAPEPAQAEAPGPALPMQNTISDHGAGETGEAAPGEDVVALVVAQIRALEEPPIALVWVPDVVKLLAPGLGVAPVLAALVEARRRALVELRPESGVGRLSAEEAALCPVGADGVPLSHVRSLSPS